MSSVPRQASLTAKRDEIDRSSELSSPKRMSVSSPTTNAAWQQITDETSGHVYFWNPESGETRWELPVAESHPQPWPAAGPSSLTDKPSSMLTPSSVSPRKPSGREPSMSSVPPQASLTAKRDEIDRRSELSSPEAGREPSMSSVPRQGSLTAKHDEIDRRSDLSSPEAGREPSISPVPRQGSLTAKRDGIDRGSDLSTPGAGREPSMSSVPRQGSSTAKRDGIDRGSDLSTPEAGREPSKSSVPRQGSSTAKRNKVYRPSDDEPTSEASQLTCFAALKLTRFIRRVRMRVHAGQRRVANRIGIFLFMCTCFHLVVLAIEVATRDWTHVLADRVASDITLGLSNASFLLHMIVMAPHGASTLLWAHYTAEAMDALIKGM